MGKEDKKVIDLYTVFKLSEQQIAERLNINPSRVRWVLKKHGIQKRTISEAVRQLYITKFGKKEFVLNKKLTSEQERLKLAGVMLYWGEGDKKIEKLEIDGVDDKALRDLMNDAFKDVDKKVEKQMRGQLQDLGLPGL